jgi:hypothetical protein
LDPTLKQEQTPHFGAWILKSVWGLWRFLGTLGSLGPRAEILKQGTKKHLGPCFFGAPLFWGLAFLGPRIFWGTWALWGPALFGPRAETGNKKNRKKIKESKRGTHKSTGPTKAQGPQKRRAHKSAGPTKAWGLWHMPLLPYG